ncbi:hypothetical protein [Candidatus Nanohalovita haloferacivicina]|uniref:hypothetical protein n=1 Tax=Candidatus Nanohalovita haloferacivicina TaxID=2978046 RepID=UPI00325F9756|nr:hypothetical protein HBNXNv_0814 [Candidatus Nanohalobia archaeon BNXNv]
MSEENKVREKDVFGLPKLTLNAEVGISFTLFILGSLLLFSVLYPMRYSADLMPAYLGFLMIMVAYFFGIEAIRELEDKEHYLSKRLMSED